MPESERQRVAVVAAMREEIGPLGKRVRTATSGGAGRLRWRRGRLRDVEIVLATTGEGRCNAEDGLRRLLVEHRPTRILGIGVAGALSSALRVGDLLLATEVQDGEETLAASDPAWLADVRSLGDWQTGRLVTVDEILVSPAARARWRQAGPPGAPLAADMESASWARVAAAHRLPYLIARAVSDRADESLPPFLARCRTTEGGIDRRKVVRQALRHPASWGLLLRLRSRMGRCGRRLADFAETVVAALA